MNYFQPLAPFVLVLLWSLSGCVADQSAPRAAQMTHTKNLDGLKPKLIVLEIGSNNTGQQGQSQAEFGGAIYQCTAQQTAEGVTAIVNRLKAKCPEAKILLLAIFPRGEKRDDKNRQQNELTNSLIKNAADGKKVFYMDINARFLTPRGVLQKDVMPDLLHPNAKGYKIWAEAIYPSVQSLLK